VSGQSTLLSIGAVRITGRARTLTGFNAAIPRGRASGASDRELHPTVEQYTDAGVQLGYSRGTRARAIKGTVRVGDTSYAELLSWQRATLGRYTPCLVIPDVTSPEAWLVRWGSGADLPLERQDVDGVAYDVAVEWEEVGRGLRP
jgi:hypothetical protein